MNQRECFEKTDEIFRQKQTNAKLRQADRQAEVERKCPQIIRLEQQMRATASSFFAAAAERDISEQEFEQLKAKSLDLQHKRTELLEENGFPADYLDMKYECPICRDTGFVGQQMCGCFKKALSEQYLKSSGMDRLYETQDFKDFDLTCYAPQERAQMNMALSFCKKYADEFGNKSPNLLFMGGPGCGKTFLTTAIGRQVISEGHFVIYTTAQDMIDTFERRKFSKTSETEDDTDIYTECELLIIDDLGTEFMTVFSETALYNVINTRMNLGRPIIISTNLSASEITGAYHDRIASRLMYGSVKLQLCGGDVRRIKEIRKTRGRAHKTDPNRD